jgi:hypothetical protein
MTWRRATGGDAMMRTTTKPLPDPFGEARPEPMFLRRIRASLPGVLRDIRDTVLAVCGLGGALALLWLVAPDAYAWLIRNEDGNGDLILVGIVVAALLVGVLSAAAQGLARSATARSKRRQMPDVDAANGETHRS